MFDGSIHALQDVTYSVPTGSVCALLGHNGAGKTTTIKILSTLLRPTSGQAIVAGYDVVRQPAQVRANIGTTGQLAALDWQLTGRENLLLFGRLRGMRRKHAQLRADALIYQLEMATGAAARCATWCHRCQPKASRSCSRRSISKKPTCSAIRSSSSMKVALSPAEPPKTSRAASDSATARW